MADCFPHFPLVQLAGSQEPVASYHDCLRPVADIPRLCHEGDMPKYGYDQLMHIVCVKWGFCGCVKHDQRLHVDQLIPSEGLVTADQFVEWVFLADDMNPNTEPERWNRHKSAIRAAFVEYMGGDRVDASQLRWSDVPQEPVTPNVKFHGPLG